MPLESGGSGGGGGSSLDDDSQESATEQEQTQQANERRRELRRDADSDPMREQTEVEETGSQETATDRDTSPGGSGSGEGLDRGRGASGDGGADSEDTSQSDDTDESANLNDSASNTTERPSTRTPSPDGSEGLERQGDTNATQANREPTGQAERQNTGEPMADSGRDTTPGASGAGEGLDPGRGPQGDTMDDTDEAEMERPDSDFIDDTSRANQSVSLGTTGLGTTGTPQSRARERTSRANETVSLGTTGLGTTGTPQSRTREQTAQANEGVSFGTDLATTQGGRDPNQTQQAEAEMESQEQYGDIDWSFGLGDPEEDEVEQFVDEKIGEEGSQWVRENVANPMREFGESSKQSNRFVSEEPPDAVDYGQDAPDTVGVGEAAGNLAIGAADIAEQGPQVPGVALEAVEGANYLLEGTTVAGGSEEKFDRRASEAIEFGGAAAAATAAEAKANPGPFAGQALIGLGAGRAIAATRLGTGTSGRVINAADIDPAKSVGRRARRFISDERAQGQVPRGLRDGPDADADVERVTSEDLDVDIDEVRSRPPDAEEQIQNVREIRQRQQELMREQSRRQSQDIDTDYTAPERGGGTSVSSQEFRTTSSGPSTFRSGPTAAQQRTYRSANYGTSSTTSTTTTRTPQFVEDISPQQSVQVTEGIRASGQAASARGSSLVGAGAMGAGASAALGTGIEEIGVGEGTTEATQPATFSLDGEANRGTPDVGLPSATAIGASFADVEAAGETTLDVTVTEDDLSPSNARIGDLTATGTGGDIIDTSQGGTRGATDTAVDVAQTPDTDLMSDTRQPVPVTTSPPASPAPTTPPAGEPGSPFDPTFGPGVTPDPDPDPDPDPTPDPEITPDPLDIDQEGDRRRRDRRRVPREGFARRRERSLLNPFTGQ